MPSQYINQCVVCEKEADIENVSIHYIDWEEMYFEYTKNVDVLYKGIYFSISFLTSSKEYVGFRYYRESTLLDNTNADVWINAVPMLLWE